jgi:hypothetical protein
MRLISLTGLSLEIYIIHSDQSSHNWCRWKGLGLELVLRIISTDLGHCGLRQLQKSPKIPQISKIAKNIVEKGLGSGAPTSNDFFQTSLKNRRR